MPQPEIQALLETIKTLRAPGGCPWDRKQTLPDAARYLLDEAGELLDAALSTDAEHVTEELGDLLFMVAFCCRIHSETSGDDFGTVARVGNEKLIRRHPHVFGNENADDQTASQVHWNAIKAAEKEAKGIVEESTVLKDLPASSSPLRQAHVYQKNAAEVGFDWPDNDGVVAKIHEELAEVREAEAAGDRDALRHEIGDLLLAVVNLARRLGVEADDALRLANRRFHGRFRHIERQYPDQDAMREASLDELEAHWQNAKRASSQD